MPEPTIGDFLLRPAGGTDPGWLLYAQQARALHALLARAPLRTRWLAGLCYYAPDRASMRLMVEDLEAAGFTVTLQNEG